MKRYIRIFGLAGCLMALVFTSTNVIAQTDQRQNSVPERITMEHVSHPAIVESLALSATLCEIRGVVFRDSELFNNLTSGDYDAVIEKAQSVIKRNAAWWEDPDLENHRDPGNFSECNPYSLAEYERVLAIAYELKGDWKKAYFAYAMTCGRESEAYRWAAIRMGYAKGLDNAWLVTDIGRLMDEERLPSVDSVIREIESYRTTANSKRNAGAGALHGIYERLDWRTLWKFRLNCALVMCPELLLISSIDGYDSSHGYAMDFFELEKENYEKFVDFFEKVCDETSLKKGDPTHNYSKKVEFLKELKEMPYKVELPKEQYRGK